MRSFSLPWNSRKTLDEPWTGWLGTAMKVTSALILTNTTVIFVLALISAIAVDLKAGKAEKDYILSHTMMVRAELIFFYCTIPLVYVATNVTENFCLWDDRVRPLYVIVASVIAINVWILQLTLWGPCMFSSKGPGYCPYLLRQSDIKLDELQTIGEPTMVFYAVPSLILMYFAYLSFGAIGMHRERKKPPRSETFDLTKSSTYSSQWSDTESQPFRNSWANNSAPPREDRDSESYISPKTRKDYPGLEEGMGAHTSLNNEPAIALMLTTPHGTTDEQDSFDDDRLSRYGHRTN